MQNVFIGQAILDVVSFSPALDELRMPQHLKMLGYVGHRLARLHREIFHGAFTLSKKLQQFETAAAGQCFADARELSEDLILELALLLVPHSKLFKRILEYLSTEQSTGMQAMRRAGLAESRPN